jgi:hypothetical protein
MFSFIFGKLILSTIYLALSYMFLTTLETVVCVLSQTSFTLKRCIVKSTFTDQFVHAFCTSEGALMLTCVLEHINPSGVTAFAVSTSSCRNNSGAAFSAIDKFFSLSFSSFITKLSESDQVYYVILPQD